MMRSTGAAHICNIDGYICVSNTKSSLVGMEMRFAPVLYTGQCSMLLLASSHEITVNNMLRGVTKCSSELNTNALKQW